MIRHRGHLFAFVLRHELFVLADWHPIYVRCDDFLVQIS